MKWIFRPNHSLSSILVDWNCHWKKLWYCIISQQTFSTGSTINQKHLCKAGVIYTKSQYIHLTITPIGACCRSHSETKGINMDLWRMLSTRFSFKHMSVRMRRPVVQRLFQLNLDVFCGVEGRAACRTLEFFYNNLNKPCLGIVMMSQVWAP